MSDGIDLPQDYLITQARGAASEATASTSSISGISGTTAGQVPVWTGAVFEAGTILSGSGISMSIVYAPSLGLQIGVNASTLRSTLGLGGPWKLSATADPTVNDDNTQGYSQGSLWFNTTGNTVYACISAGTGTANWVKLSP